jgi:hypothetical protein
MVMLRLIVLGLLLSYVQLWRKLRMLGRKLEQAEVRLARVNHPTPKGGGL